MLISRANRWLQVVNEFGALGIDDAVIQGAAAEGQASTAAGAVTVHPLAGGCLCCATAGLLNAALAQIVSTPPTPPPHPPKHAHTLHTRGRTAIQHHPDAAPHPNLIMCVQCNVTGTLELPGPLNTLKRPNTTGLPSHKQVRRSRPDRLIIEPSGLGHPAGGRSGSG